MNQETYRKLISGRSRGVIAAVLRFFLQIAAAGYMAVIGLRNFLYSKGWLKIHRVNAMVISVGNITAGGTGKTPLVIWLYQKIVQSAKCKVQKCGILTRGYKTRRASGVMRRAKDSRNTQYAIRNTLNDEPAILAESCPNAKVIVNPDRVAGAFEAINQFGANVLILDDGFQHRRLHRDLDIVTIDATLPFGYGRLLPAGLLREPVTSLKRADAAILTRCDQITEIELSQLEGRLQRINPDMAIARSIHAPISVKYLESFVIPAKVGIHKNNEIMDSCLHRNDGLEQLKGKKIFAFCGIGNPDSFLSTIKKLGAVPVGSRVYDDHYYYTEEDITVICEKAKKLKADLILTTQKDWSKLSIENRKSKIEIPFAYLVIEIKFIGGEDKIIRLIENTLAGKILKK